MLLFRAAFNGIGSGAGVAWPFFGIVFTLLGGAIGGMISLTLGIAAIFLFITIGIGIFYFSYKEMKEKEQFFQGQLQKNKQKLLIDLTHYLDEIERFTTSPDFNDYFKKTIAHDLTELSDIHSPLHKLLTLVLNEYNLHQRILDRNELVLLIENTALNESTPFFRILTSAFFGFVGTFGAIAGCSAGVSGLLTGMGVFTSFAAFPILGWGVIGIALVLGLIAALGAVNEACELYKNEKQNDNFKRMHKQLELIVKNNMEKSLYPAKNPQIFTPVELPPMGSMFLNTGDQSFVGNANFFPLTREGDTETSGLPHKLPVF